MAQANFGKDPLTPSHGDSLVDQSFESLKSKEIRDSMSPTHDMNFHSLTLKHPNTTGWDVQTSSEVSPDGRAYRSETLATTDGVEKINGGTAEFKGRNEQRSSASHQGDDKNFVKKASESSNTHLQEKVVIGDENSGRTEMKMSSTSTSSSSQVVSSSTVEYDDEHVPSGNRYLMDNTNRHQLQNEHNRMQRLQEEEFRQREQLQRQRQQQQQQQQHEYEQRQRLENQTTSTQQRQQQYSQEYNTNREETSTSRNVETQNHYEENKRYVDMDKASPEYQRQVQYLMAQPGEIISNTVEYPKPNVKMITTVKRLPDGTIVKNKRYETEELRPANERTQQRSTTTTNQSSTQRKNERHVQEQENIRRQQAVRETDDYVTQTNSPHRRPNADVVDNIETTHHTRDYDTRTNKQQLVESHPKDQYPDDVANITKSFSTVKKSSRRFSTETTSETIEEVDDHSPRHKSVTSGRPSEDFSTHGFPSVKPNKPTQEYPTDRPHSATPSNDFSTQGFPSVKPNKMTQEYPTERPHQASQLDRFVVDSKKTHSELSPRNYTTNIDGDVVVVSSESTRNFKHKTNSERTIETEIVTSDSDRTKQIESTTINKSEDYSTHGFPSVKDSSPLREISPRQGTPIRQTQPDDDFSTNGFPSVRSPTKGKPDYTTQGFPSSRDIIKSNKNIIVTPSSRGEEVITISSERTKNAKHNTTSERIIEVATDDDYTSSRPHYQQPISGNQNRNRPEDFSTHGFPSVKDKTPTREFSPRHDDYPQKSPTKTPDYSTHGFPSAKESTKSRPVAPRHSPTSTTPTARKPSTESTQKLIQKEKEVDAAHRAFAASLRSSSPIDNNRRDSYSDHQRQTPRSSVSSTRTTPRRELREGSHDSAAPSDHSRISSTTVTRQSPTKTTGKTVVTKHTVVKTKNMNGSNDTIDLTPQRSTKSPSPGKTTVTTTTKTTTTKKIPAEVPKPDNQLTKPAENLFPINEPLTITKSNFTANDASFERNEAVEAPCIKKNFYLVGPSDKVSNKSIDELIVNNFPAQPQLSEKENQTNNDSKMTNTTTSKTTLQNTDGVEKRTERTNTETTEAPITTTKTTTVSTANKPENEDLTKHVTTANNQEQLLLHERSSPHSPAPNIHKPRTNANTRSPTRDYKPANIDDQIIIKPSSPIGKKHEERRTVVRETTFEKDDNIDTISENKKMPKQKPKTTDEPVAETPYKTELTENVFEIIDDIERVKNKQHISSEKIEVNENIFDDHDHVETRSLKKNKNKQPIQPSESSKPSNFKQPVELKETTQGPKTINTEVTSQKTKTTRLKNIDSKSFNQDQKKAPLNRSPDTDEEEYIPTTDNETTIIEEILEIGTKNTDIPKDKKKSPKPEYDNKNLRSKPSSRTPSPEKTTTTKDTIFSTTQVTEINPVTKPVISTTEKNDTSKTKKYTDDEKVEELFDQTSHKKRITSKHDIDEFISNELKHQLPINKELPDGGLISKSKDPVPTSPTFKKKGLSRRETFEERCRQILGMEDNGDTQGKYHNRPDFETKPDDESPKEFKENQNDLMQFEVTIEDCNDDEPLDINNVKQSLLKKELKETKKKQVTKNPEEVFEPTSTTIDTNKTRTINKYEKQDLNTVDTTNDTIIKTLRNQNKVPDIITKTQPRETNKVIEETTIVVEKQRLKTKPSEPFHETHSSDSETESSGNVTEVETEQENYVSEKVVNLDDILSTEVTVKSFKTEKPLKQSITEPKPVPKTKVTKTPSKSKIDIVETKRTSKALSSTTKQTVSKKNDEQAVTKQQPKKPTTKQPSRDNLIKPNDKSTTVQVSQRTTQKSSVEKTSPSTTTKDKKSPSPSRVQRKPVDVSGDSSPDISPSRLSERRRSSNISVHTEIIIEHASPKSPRKNETTPKTQPRTPKEPTDKDLLEKTLTHKPNRKLAVTERKESAPVQRVSRKDKDVKMPRSTSEQKIKVGTKPVTKPAINSLSPNLSVKSDHRPNKCFATKTINLVTIDKTLNSEDMENVIIDIQQAKSSREPSPDKIVPTPVPADMDTGKPRYPDVVQEPEEEPRKKPHVKNIPIFEEETNEYVGCQISEVQTEQITKTKEYIDYNDDNLDHPIVEAPKSLDYTTVNKSDDESLLSVQEKVSKFIHTAEEVTKPKVSTPFSRDFAEESTVPENDDSLLTVDQKVTKFLQTAESITKPMFTTKPEFERPKYDDIDEDLRHDDCILSVSQKVNKFIDTAEKLAPTTPQKSPELVARIERNISRQSEPEYPNLSDQEESITPFSENHTVEIEMKRQKDILSRPSVWQNKKEENQKTTETTTKNIYVNTDDKKVPFTEDELIPMTKKHTIDIELKRQNDILSRPSVFQTNNVPQKQPLSSEPKTYIKTKEKISDKKSFVSEKIDVENSVSDIKNRSNKPLSKYQSTSVSATKSKFETPKNEISPIKRKPSFEYETPMKSGPKNPSVTKLETTVHEIHPHTSESETELSVTTTRRSSSKVKDNITNIEDKIPHSKKPTHMSSPQYKKSTNNSHSPIQSPNTFTKPNVTKITERTSMHTTPTKIITTDTVESILEPSSPTSQTTITKGKNKVTTTESIAARRNIFEKGIPAKPSKSNTPVQTGRRPSYMDHTMSSLEHRKDSLELNKTNYARKSSTEDDSLYERRPNSAVKFRVPEKIVGGPISNIDDVNIEEIFDLEILEQMLEITTSYEIRRRIRAQIRLVKKNMLNTQYIERANADSQKSTVLTTSEKTTKTQSTYETRDKSILSTKATRKSSERSFSPDDRSSESVQEPEDLEFHRKPREHSPTSKTISSSLKEVRRVTETSRTYPHDTVLTEEKLTTNTDKLKNRAIDHSIETRTEKQRIGSESPTCTYKSQEHVTVHVERIPKGSRDHSPEAKTISSSLKEVRRSTESTQHKEPYSSKDTTSTKQRDESVSPSLSKTREPSPDWKNKSSSTKQGSRVTEISNTETVTTDKTIKTRKQSGGSTSPTRSKPRDHSPDAKTISSSLKERKHRDGSISLTSSKSRDHSPEAKTISSMLKEVRRVSGEQESYSTHRTTQMEVVDTVEKVKTPILDRKRQPVSSPDRTSKPILKGQSAARTPSPDKLKKQEYGISSQKEDTTRKRTDNISKIQPKARVPQTSDNRTGKQQEREHYTVTKTTVKTSYSPERKPSSTKVDEKTPIWADRKNILKNQSSSVVKKTPSPSATRSSVTRTMKSSTQHQCKTFNEEDSITSSYGIGPTDENGLPLFGIKALRKKKQPEQPCETKEEVTGYVVEEKYYSDSKTKPTVQRKEYIYSTNADELEQIKKKVDSRKSSRDAEVTRTFQQIETGNELDGTKALTMSMPISEDFSTSTTKHVRRGSVKEMSEKFIRKESSQSITEKSSSYPKAGLILRSTPRLSSGDATDAFESTTDIITRKFSANDSQQDFDTGDQEFDVEHSKTVQTESESECESVKILRETNQKSTRSSTSTRSFLNTSGDSKVVTGVDDALERMRNADNVVEEGDTAEDQEARALLNKFLGASVIMRGVESALPTKQTRTTVTTYADDDGDKTKREIKTTRVTKTIKSGSSSSPVTYKTCAIEEIWDEELLKELLEQATNYEERRKIRARLRELMAEREENKNLKASEQATPATNTEDDESSASEYEEIIEEVTDYSESEGETELKKSTSLKKETDEDITKAATVKEDSEKAVLKKSSSTKSNDSLKTDISTTSFVSVEEIEEAVEKNTEKSKDNAINIVIEKVTTAVESLTTKTTDSIDSANSVDTQKTEQGESHLTLQEDSLQQNMLLSKAAAQNSNNSVLNKNLNKNINTQQNINKLSANKTCANKVISYSNDSSMLTVSNSNNTHTNTKTHTNTNKIPIEQNLIQQQQQQQNLKPQQTTNEPTPTVVSNDLVSNTSSNTNQVNRLGVPQIEDSGTESGEDLRLIAAGLRDKLNMQTDTDLIEEVTAALSRLENSLKEGKDIPVDSNKRNALLALVARLQTGLTSPDKLADAALAATEINAGDINFEETSSPEADAHRSNRQRFAKRRNRNSRHTVGVSREELADARRYMEDMLIIDNISNCTTPESNLAPVTPPQWFPIEKNSSTGSISNQQPPLPLYRPNQFVPNNIKNSTECLGTPRNPVDLRKNITNVRRPLSGDYSVSFQQLDTNAINSPIYTPNPTTNQNGSSRAGDNISPDSAQKSNRFTSKKTLYKRANTIDIPKTKKYNADLDTDSEMEDRGPGFGLKRTVQVNVKQKVRSVVPPFEPKTENDHKFLAFINKQSPKPGLGWNNSRSVTNWTNKFGNIKHTFEVGAAATTTTGKPPQAPGHVPQNAAKNYWNKQLNQNPDRSQAHNAQINYQNQRNQQEIIERQRRAEREFLERERIERERERIEKDRLERQRLEKERQNRDRLEREFYERERQERERLAAEQHAAMPSMTVPKPAPVNKFIHAPQSVFRPIDNDLHQQNVIRPIPKMPNNGNVWQPPSQSMISPQMTTIKNYSSVPYANSAPSTPSPGALPWVSKPTVDNSIFKIRANKFEEQSLKDDRNNTYLQRHNSLRSSKTNQQPMEDYRKRPSLPNTTDPYLALQSQYVPNQFNNNYQQPPPPTNISFTYADLRSKSNYQSYPCLPSAVNMALENPRPREDSLTNPEAVPLVLTSLNPSYSPQTENLQPYSTMPQKQSDYLGSMDSAHTSPSILTMPTMDYTDDDLDSDNMMEYRAETRVMRKPQSQTAVTIGSRQAHVSDDEVFGKNSRAARSLLNTMKSIGNNNNNGKKMQKEAMKKPEPPSSPKICLSPDGRSYQAPLVEPLFPEVTNFEAKRLPVYDNTQKQTIQQNKLTGNSKTKTANHDKEYDYSSDTHSGTYFKNNQQQSYQSNVQAAYVNETQPAYIVTYPTDDVSDFEDNNYVKQQHSAVGQHRNRHISENSTTSSSMTYSTPSSNINWTANPIHTDESHIMQKNYINPTEYLNMNSNYAQNIQQPSTNIINSPRNDIRDKKPDLAPKPQSLPLSNLPPQQYIPQPRLSQPEIVTKPQPRGIDNSMLQDIPQQTQYSAQYSAQIQNQYSPQTPPINHQLSKQNQYVPQVQPISQQVPIQSNYSPQAPLPIQQMPTQNIYSPQAQSLTQQTLTESNYTSQAQSFTQQLPILNNYSPQIEPLSQQMPPQNNYSPQVQQIAQPMPAQSNYLPQTKLIAPQTLNQNEYSNQIQSIPQQIPSQDQYLAQAQTIGQQITTQSQYSSQAQPINQQKPKQDIPNQSQKQLSHAPHVSLPETQRVGGQNLQQKSSTKKQPTQQQKEAPQSVSTVKQQPKLSIYQTQSYNHQSIDLKKLLTETTSKSQSVVKTQKLETKTKPQAPLLRQSTYTDGIVPLQAQNRVLSQQSLAIKQQQQIQQQQQITELRRKSLGNALDIQQQQRKSAYFENQKEIKQEYKSSAPADTPDIVKSSLPKEDMPILKKFGPPQRHHYMPNAYQSPSGGSTTTSISTTQTKKTEPNGNIVNTTRNEVVHHSTFTNKPAIVEIPATPQPNEDLIPRNIVFNNVSAFSSMSRRCEEERSMEYQPQTRPNRLSKSDSWNQIVQMQNQQVTSPTSPKFNTSGNELRRTRSGHSLAVPKMFEAGMDKAEISEKQKTVAAYFTGKKSPSNVASEEQEQVTIRKSAINRTKTSEKVSASRKSLSSATANSIIIGGGLSRSATMPHIANLNLLDETNVEDAFEQLMMGS